MWERIKQVLSTCDNFTTFYGQPVKDIDPNFYTKIRHAGKWHCDDLRHLHDAAIQNKPVAGAPLDPADQAAIKMHYANIADKDDYSRPQLALLVQKIVPDAAQANFFAANGFVFDLFCEDLIEANFLSLQQYRDMALTTPLLYEQKVALLEHLARAPNRAPLALLFYRRFLEPDEMDMATLDKVLKVLF